MQEKTREDYRATVVIVDGHRNAAQNAEEEIERIRDDLQKGQEVGLEFVGLSPLPLPACRDSSVFLSLLS